VAWLAATGWLTMRSVGPARPVPFWGFFTEVMAGVDYAQNVVLFLPLGWIVARADWSWRRALLAGLFVSGAIEFAQLWVPGRTTQASDILCNTAGAALGWWMASPVRRPRARLAIAFATLAVLLGLHQLNTTWPDIADRADGAGVWQTVSRVACPDELRDHAICVVVPNVAQGGSKYVRVVGPSEATFARVQSDAHGRRVARRDCVIMMFESTIGARLKLRPPLAAACGVADTSELEMALNIGPRLEHERTGAWTPTRASVWTWPVWPFTAYQPMVQVAAGALLFIVLTSLLIAASAWYVPAGYFAMLEVVAFVAGFRMPGWWEALWIALAWGVALAAVALDRWWRHAMTPVAETAPENSL